MRALAWVLVLGAFDWPGLLVQAGFLVQSVVSWPRFFAWALVPGC